MAKRFRLERVLQHRRREETAGEAALAAAVRREQEAQQVRDRLTALLDAEQQRERAARQQALQPAALERSQAYRDLLAHAITDQSALVDALAREVRQARAALLERRQARRALEKLEERHDARRAAAAQRQETIAMDEAATAQTARRLHASATASAGNRGRGEETAHGGR